MEMHFINPSGPVLYDAGCQLTGGARGMAHPQGEDLVAGDEVVMEEVIVCLPDGQQQPRPLLGQQRIPVHAQRQLVQACLCTSISASRRWALSWHCVETQHHKMPQLAVDDAECTWTCWLCKEAAGTSDTLYTLRLL